MSGRDNGRTDADQVDVRLRVLGLVTDEQPGAEEGPEDSFKTSFMKMNLSVPERLPDALIDVHPVHGQPTFGQRDAKCQAHISKTHDANMLT